MLDNVILTVWVFFNYVLGHDTHPYVIIFWQWLIGSYPHLPLIILWLEVDRMKLFKLLLSKAVNLNNSFSSTFNLITEPWFPIQTYTNSWVKVTSSPLHLQKCTFWSITTLSARTEKLFIIFFPWCEVKRITHCQGKQTVWCETNLGLPPSPAQCIKLHVSTYTNSLSIW